MDSKLSNHRAWLWLIMSLAVATPAIALRASGYQLSFEVTILVFGLGIVAAALLLSWAAEAAQLDVSASLAIALLAVVTILPEFAIEWLLAWQAGRSPEDVQTVARVAAAVTGSNRLLIGLGWALVALIFWFRNKGTLEIKGGIPSEVFILAVATLITFLIFPFGQIALFLAIPLIIVYLFYLWLSSRAKKTEPVLIGPSAMIGSLPTPRRRSLVAFLFAYSAAAIFASAKPFVEGLIDLGETTGVNDFILIQWLVPLATEFPEILVAVIFTLRGNQVHGLVVLISAELNQLALLLGTLPIVFSIALGQVSGIELEHRQEVEFFLMSAMSIFGVVLLARGRLPWYGALLLLVLFITHLFFPETSIRLTYAFIFLGLTLALLLVDRGRILQLYQMGRSVYHASMEKGPT